MSETNWFEEPKGIVMLIAFLLTMMFGMFGFILGIVIALVMFIMEQPRDASTLVYGLLGALAGSLIQTAVSLIFLGTL